MFSKLRAVRSWKAEILIAVAALFIIPFAASYEYCHFGLEKELCGERDHVACYTFKSPFYVATVPMTNTLIALMLELLNTYRDLVARTERASCLRSFVWHYELALIAKKHSTHCSKIVPDCAASRTFKYSEPIIGMSWTKHRRHLQSVIEELFGNFTVGEKKSENLGYFTNEYNSHVGCSIGYESRPAYPHNYHLTCIFSDGIKSNPPPFRKYGSYADCYNCWGAKSDSAYKRLCANDGTIRPRGFVYQKKSKDGEKDKA